MTLVKDPRYEEAQLKFNKIRRNGKVSTSRDALRANAELLIYLGEAIDAGDRTYADMSIAQIVYNIGIALGKAAVKDL